MTDNILSMIKDITAPVLLILCAFCFGSSGSFDTSHTLLVVFPFVFFNMYKYKDLRIRLFFNQIPTKVYNFLLSQCMCFIIKLFFSINWFYFSIK